MASVAVSPLPWVYRKIQPPSGASPVKVQAAVIWLRSSVWMVHSEMERGFAVMEIQAFWDIPAAVTSTV